ncbi:MAG: N-glycosylase/DNA lyase [Candidatus Aenigmarchaeota archaeon]|nr:N-glycosylase/DNA lyase [Candidatus Aenigmarchaeota archaeon]NIQ18062.1 N-glycosylase/DNA lyase [Candidatus Aenigmarchaeota archaeon]
MEGIFGCVCDLRKSGLKERVDSRLREFKEIGEKSNEDIFNEMCFCILTANYSAEGGMRIQKAIGNGFLKLPEKDLARKLSELGHRYPQLRAKFIAEARKHHGSLKETIRSFGSEENAREWIVKNVKGLGYKEASHFLRNIGFENLAIIDFHIIDILSKHGLIERPKTLTKKKYLEIEKILKEIAKKLDMNLAELDLYLWYEETGKVLK